MALAGMLSVLTPVSARLAGERAAKAPTASTSSRVVQNAVTRERPRPPVIETQVLGASSETDDEPEAEPHLLVRAEPGLVARRHASRGAAPLGTVATSSKYYGAPLMLWVEEVKRRGGQDWGLVELPYVYPLRDGWIALAGLRRDTTWITVRIDLSKREVVVERRGETLYEVDGAIGSSVSPTPPGEYVVTDRVAFSVGSSLGSFAFGISGIQPALPPGWSGGDQLAIHGTNQPWSIGRSVSAGCVRVSEQALDRFKPLLRQGTPVIVVP